VNSRFASGLFSVSIDALATDVCVAWEDLHSLVERARRSGGEHM
jgi:hypothetical protein